MKWIAIASLALSLTACGYTNTEVVEYREVVATPVVDTVNVVDEEPLDVTTTTVMY